LVGDLVAVAVRNLFDQAVGFQAAQVVGHLPRGEVGGVKTTKRRDEQSQVAVAEAVGLQGEHRQGGEQGLAALLPDPQPGDPGAADGGDRVGDGMQGINSDDGVVADGLDAQQAPVGGEADLPQCGQICQSFPDTEIVGVVDGGLGPQCLPFAG